MANGTTMRIVFSGSIGRFQFGGHAWANLQYLAGLTSLGHEVFYLEDCGEQSYVYDWETGQATDDLRAPSEYVRRCLEPIGMGDRYIYRAGDRAEGMSVSEFADVCAQANLLIVRAVPFEQWRAEYSYPRRRIFIDVDPGFTQVSLLQGNARLASTVEHCDRLFTVAQRLGTADCSIPVGGKPWVKTVPPIWLPAWPIADSEGTGFTLVLQWKSFPRSHRYGRLSHGGSRLEQKSHEFGAFVDLPGLTGAPFRIALTGGPDEMLAAHGWDVVPGWQVTKTAAAYHEFIAGSAAELGIAKHGYVATRGGWFSDRSVCYLAAGRPVLLQDTGLADWLPVGAGVLVFSDLDGAVRGVEAVLADYDHHRRVARQLAEEHFSTDRVLPALLDAAMG